MWGGGAWCSCVAVQRARACGRVCVLRMAAPLPAGSANQVSRAEGTAQRLPRRHPTLGGIDDGILQDRNVLEGLDG